MDVAADPLGMDVEIDYQAQLQRFGLSTFRPGQQQVLDAINAGRDCLCIMPTGGGKSLCFQLPAISRDGTVLVISPLIALMKDQVDALVQLNISATYINSSLGSAEQRDRISSMAQNRYDLVYVAPERVRSRFFFGSVGQNPHSIVGDRRGPLHQPVGARFSARLRATGSDARTHRATANHCSDRHGH